MTFEQVEEEAPAAQMQQPRRAGRPRWLGTCLRLWGAAPAPAPAQAAGAGAALGAAAAPDGTTTHSCHWTRKEVSAEQQALGLRDPDSLSNAST
jgi:hypothetical protein